MVIRRHFELRETIATILADREGDIEAAGCAMTVARRDIERYILIDPFFKTSFDPISVRTDTEIIQRMAWASKMAGVGPMAAVAGAVADAGIKEMIRNGATFGVIDNGGDIALISDREIRVGLYAGDSPISGKFAFLIKPTQGIFGICTSSATVGHSISLGTADSVTVFADDPVLADATATAVCNLLSPEDLSVLDSVNADIKGIFAIFGSETILWGEIPTLVQAKVSTNQITAGGIGYHPPL